VLDPEESQAKARRENRKGATKERTRFEEFIEPQP
jgi:hypothetical protein